MKLFFFLTMQQFLQFLLVALELVELFNNALPNIWRHIFHTHPLHFEVKSEIQIIEPCQISIVVVELLIVANQVCNFFYFLRRRFCTVVTNRTSDISRLINIVEIIYVECARISSTDICFLPGATPRCSLKKFLRIGN